MINLIEDNLEQIHELCERFHVQRLEVFGSAADGRYREGESDLDFIVEFQPLAPGALARAFFGLLRALEALFRVRVDLLTLKPEYDVNPHLRAEIEQARRVVYERHTQAVPV
ncbi:MAG: nucleotidyltransferase domain-containing protein [Armatimonadota bacterium]